jgi:hypothetical protein
MHSLTEKPEAQATAKQKNPDQNAYDCDLPMLTKK